MLRLALLISGGGTTAEAIIKACGTNCALGSMIEPALVIASNENAGGIQRTRNAGIGFENILVIDPKTFATPQAFGERIIEECQKRRVDLIGQYGWMVKTPINVLDAFKGMMINQHPGPLDPGQLDFGGPGMYGMRVHAARLYFVRMTKRNLWTEATAQRVFPKFDDGPVLKAVRVPIEPHDTPESLQQKVLPVEREVQIATLLDFAHRRVVELPARTDSLVLFGEEDFHSDAKDIARLLYPRG
jgi:phosphoribosylglycinamide formyltransferase-1